MITKTPGINVRCFFLHFLYRIHSIVSMKKDNKNQNKRYGKWTNKFISTGILICLIAFGLATYSLRTKNRVSINDCYMRYEMPIQRMIQAIEAFYQLPDEKKRYQEITFVKEMEATILSFPGVVSISIDKDQSGTTIRPNQNMHITHKASWITDTKSISFESQISGRMWTCSSPEIKDFTCCVFTKHYTENHPSGIKEITITILWPASKPLSL